MKTFTNHPAFKCHQKLIREAMHALAGGANLSAKWSKDCNGDATEEYRLEVLNQYFNDTINILSLLVDGYRPGNLDIKKS